MHSRPTVTCRDELPQCALKGRAVCCSITVPAVQQGPAFNEAYISDGAPEVARGGVHVQLVAVWREKLAQDFIHLQPLATLALLHCLSQCVTVP